MELDPLYALTGPDGTRIGFGNSAAAVADSDWIGQLNPDEGITGLDSPDMRENAAEIIGGHGGIHYDFFHGRRPILISGIIFPEGRTATVVNQLEQKIRRATNAMKGDAILRWTNAGYPARRLTLRRQQPVRIGGRRPKNVQIAMVCPDYRILADAETASAVTAHSVAAMVTNAGDEPATPRFSIVGPMNPTLTIRNITTGLNITFKATFTLAAGETLIVDTAPPYPSVKVNGVDRYDAISYLTTSWWGLIPGTQSVRVDAASGTGTWQVFYRSAWI